MRFSLIGAAGELATRWGITGWEQGKAMAAAATCFKAWLAHRGGAGNLEELNMMAQVTRFFELHGESRFTDWHRPASNTDSHPPRTIQRAGYRKHKTDSVTDGHGNVADIQQPIEYYVFPQTFKQEICNGFDYRTVCKMMVSKGWLMPASDKGFTRKERLPGGEGTVHCFRVTDKVLDGGNADE